MGEGQSIVDYGNDGGVGLVEGELLEHARFAILERPHRGAQFDRLDPANQLLELWTR